MSAARKARSDDILVKAHLKINRRDHRCQTTITIEGLFDKAEEYAQMTGGGFDRNVALEFWWDLARSGAIALLGGNAGSTPYKTVPDFVFTERGRRLLTQSQVSPHDRTRYMAALRQRVLEPDATVIAYIEEAIAAWQANLYRSTAVMTGCACERLIILLAKAVSVTAIEPYASDIAKMLASNKPVPISTIFDKVRGALTTAAHDRIVTGSLADAIERKLTPIFERVRMLRNEAGHPTGETVSAEEAEVGLLLFPSFCEFSSEWIGALPRG